MSQNGLDKPKNDQKNLRAQTLQLSEEVIERLLELQEKGIDVNEFLLNALHEREERIGQEKMRLAKEQDEKTLIAFRPQDSKSATSRRPQDSNLATSRRLPAAIRRILSEEYGTKCALPYCRKSSENIHHTQRFSLSKSHNPYFLASLCEDHHTIAHSIDIKYVEARRGYGFVGFAC